MTTLVHILLICGFLQVCTSDTNGAQSDNLKVTTSHGPIEGITLQAATGKYVDAFLGIPYAASPTGEKRFAPPREPEKWTDTLEVKSLPVSCMQGKLKQYTNPDFLFWENNATESEDCLKLNVWLPKPRRDNVPVMVWIYGGCFQTGSSNIELYDGRTLSSEEEIIVVSFNYRLSAYGFLYLDRQEAPGNVGLIDQVAALKWVQDNIKQFGGDPNKVTLAGESAGGASVGFHLLLSSSLNLFHRAILQSGTTITSWATKSKKDSLDISLQFSRELGCVSSNKEETDDILQCLRSKSSDEIQEALQTTDDDDIAPFPPVIDGLLLADHPKSLMKQHKFCDSKQVLIGSTAQDGAISIPNFFRNKNFDEDSYYTAQDIQGVLEKLLGPDHVRHVEAAMKLYLKPDDQETPVLLREKLIEVLTEVFICNDNAISDHLASAGNEIYKYRFIRRASNSILPSWTGSVHGDEIPFMFGAPLNITKGFNAEDIQLSRSMMKYWGNFIKSGTPNLKSDSLSNWPRYNLDNKPTFYLDVQTKIVEKDRSEECAFWQKHRP